MILINFISSSEFIALTLTFLSILFINPDKTLPGPISINSVTPFSIINKTHSRQRTLLSICLTNNSFSSFELDISFPVTFEIRIFFGSLNFNEPKNILISNVTGKEISDSNELKELLVKQIESSVRWRESVLLMIEKGVTEFIEIGPGKILSGLIKRIDRNVKVSAINSEEDIKLININE